MSNKNIVRILNLHCIYYMIDAGRIFAEEVYTVNGKIYSNFIDVTGWTHKELYSWLGY